MADTLTPKAIVAALDEHIIGQKDAKRAVAVALRNRWRRQRLGPDLRDEVTPKNILMIGPTGCGKTEISRRLARLAEAPFVKVEATKFTEVGYVGRDVEQIARDLVEEAIRLEKDRRREAVRESASEAAMERLLDALVGDSASEATRQSFRERITQNAMNDVEVEIEVQDQPATTMDIPGMGGNVGMIDLSDMFGKAMGKKPTSRRKLRVPEAWDRLVDEEAEKRMDQDDVARVALQNAETNGIVFLDEIDKIAVSDVRGGSVSREGVQRDLLPLIEGTTVATKHGPMKTDHVLFIASGAFHVSKPSDMLPELQGRLPIRVELRAPAIHRADRDREGHARHHGRGGARGRQDRRAGERGGREYRRPPPADGDGAAGGRHQLRGRRARGRNRHYRCRLCARTARRPRAGYGSEQVYLVIFEIG